MAADFNTTITLRGNKTELKAAMEIIQKLTEGEDWYIEEEFNFSFEDDEELEGLIEEADGEIEYNCMGPYGRLGFLDEVDIFQQIVKVAPTIDLEGSISGFSTGQREEATARTQDGKLILRYYVRTDDSDTYADYVEGFISYLDICAVMNQINQIVHQQERVVYKIE